MLGIVAVESERRKICFFFFHLFERKIAKKMKIDTFGDCKAQLFFFNANNRGMDAK